MKGSAPVVERSFQLGVGRTDEPVLKTSCSEETAACDCIRSISSIFPLARVDGIG